MLTGLLLTAAFQSGCNRPPDEAAFVQAIIDRDQAVIDRGLAAGVTPNARNKHGDTALIWAAYRRDVALVDSLLQRGADPNLAGSYGKTPLHWAAGEGALETAFPLLDAGAAIDSPDDRGRSPLMHAAKAGHTLAIEQLIARGADPDRGDREGETALMLALRQGHADAVEALILNGADLEITNANGHNVLWLAVKKDRRNLLTASSILEKYPDMAQRLNQALKTRIVNGDPPPMDPAVLARRIHELVNRERKRAGAKPLNFDPSLAAIAADHSRDMARRGFFSHVDPSGQGLDQRLSAKHYPYRGAPPFHVDDISENLYRGKLYSGSTAEVEGDQRALRYHWHTVESLAKNATGVWRENKRAREHLLGSHFDAQGIGVAFDSRRQVFVTQTLCRKAGEPTTVKLNMDARPKLDPTWLNNRVLSVLNGERAKLGRQPLTRDPLLDVIAAEHSADMARHGQLRHVNSRGEDLPARAERHGYALTLEGDHFSFKAGLAESVFAAARYARTTEEIERGVRRLTYDWRTPEELAQTIVNGLLARPGFRNQLLSDAFGREGAGIAFDERDQVYFTYDLALSDETTAAFIKDEQDPGNRPALDLSALAQRIHELVNVERRKNGLDPLRYHLKLAAIAAKHSRDMSDRNYFAHISPDGLNASARATLDGLATEALMKDGRTKSGVGENIFYDRLYSGKRLSVKEGKREIVFLWRDADAIAVLAVTGWMNSPGHRANILGPFYDSQGIGVVVDDQNRIYITQNLF